MTEAVSKPVEVAACAPVGDGVADEGSPCRVSASHDDRPAGCRPSFLCRPFAQPERPPLGHPMRRDDPLVDGKGLCHVGAPEGEEAGDQEVRLTRVDRHEVAAGAAEGRPRVKLVDWQALLDIAQGD